MHRQDYDFTIIWIIYIHCALWLVACTLGYWANGLLKNLKQTSFVRVWINRVINSVLSIKTRHVSPLSSYGISGTLWAFRFNYHFYLYLLFPKHTDAFRIVP